MKLASWGPSTTGVHGSQMGIFRDDCQQLTVGKRSKRISLSSKSKTYVVLTFPLKRGAYRMVLTHMPNPARNAPEMEHEKDHDTIFMSTYIGNALKSSICGAL